MNYLWIYNGLTCGKDMIVTTESVGHIIQIYNHDGENINIPFTITYDDTVIYLFFYYLYIYLFFYYWII